MGERSAPAQVSAPGQRLDQWLWFARVVKSRTLAASLITHGKFRVNRQKVEKPSAVVRPGDVITSSVQRTVRVLKIVAIGKRRGPATEAQELYEDITPPAEARPDMSPNAGPAVREAGSGRPTKKERRQIDKFRGRKL